MTVEPQKEQRWLARLVGEWTYESVATGGAGEPPVRQVGTESVRSLDGVWVVCEGRGEIAGAGTAPAVMTTLMTLGYDPARARYVGSFVGSMMPQLWVYEGELDAAGEALTLDTEGPSVLAGEGTAKYKDVIEFRGDDHRVLTSNVLGADGRWHEFMTASYRRRTA